ncbi:MAG TPA: HEAT repeat domain-containing protein [Fimbriimonadaceae bacterium]|nr:HEAT repeat domain-containing protein [Fimbriimonadaceae bacterium]
MDKRTKNRQGKGPRTWLVLLVLVASAAVLWVINSLSVAREIRVATGPPTPEQAAFFADAADRPDLEAFFKGLKKAQQLAFARNTGKHDMPEAPRLIAKLLTTFDPDVRQQLTESLAAVAKTQPEATSQELKHGGNFQRLGVFRALREAGPDALPHVVARLEQDDTRANALAFLVEAGEAATPHLLKALSSQNKSARIAAADALGKIRSQVAVPGLIERYRTGEPDEKVSYLAALALIGHPATESMLTRTLLDTSQPVQIRAHAALGLGRIGTGAAVRHLWSLVETYDLDFRSTVISALRLAGDAALRHAPADVQQRTLIQVAADVRSPAGDRVIQGALQGPHALLAAGAAKERPSLAASLLDLLKRSGGRDAELADAVIAALQTTPSGNEGLVALEDRPDLAGLIARRRKLQAEAQPTVGPRA